MELNLCHFPDNTVHAFRFLGQDIGTLKLDEVTQLSFVLSQSWFFQMIKLHVPLVLLGPGLNETPTLSNVDLTTLTGDVVNAQCFQAEVILDRLKETGDLPRWEAYSFDVMSISTYWCNWKLVQKRARRWPMPDPLYIHLLSEDNRENDGSTCHCNHSVWMCYSGILFLLGDCWMIQLIRN